MATMTKAERVRLVMSAEAAEAKARETGDRVHATMASAAYAECERQGVTVADIYDAWDAARASK